MKLAVPTPALAAALLIAGCGSSSAPRAPAPAPAGAQTATIAAAAGLPARAGCATTVADTLGRVAAHIYNQAASGGNATAALAGAQASSALRTAVAAGDAGAVRAAAAAALNGPTVRIQVRARGRLLADLGNAAALAPASAVLHGGGGRPIGEVTVSVQGQFQYASTVQRLTHSAVLLGAQVPAPRGPGAGSASTGTLSQRPLHYRGRAYRMVSFNARAFPSGSLPIALLAPAHPAAALCASAAADTRAATVGDVAKQIYAQELSSGEVTAALRYAQGSRPFVDAVSRADAAATRAAIKTFFQTRIHIVRVRAFRGSRLVTDLGGPYVLAPVQASLNGTGGQRLGHFLLAVQDDAGYVKLVHRFTGAEALLIDHGRPVASSLSPTPAVVPGHGTVRINGTGYRVYSFTVTAFPSGPLLASILVPAQL